MPAFERLRQEDSSSRLALATQDHLGSVPSGLVQAGHQERRACCTPWLGQEGPHPHPPEGEKDRGPDLAGSRILELQKASERTREWKKPSIPKGATSPLTLLTSTGETHVFSCKVEVEAWGS